MSLLSALQFADSAFPGGGFAFSGGLEQALAEGRADPKRLEDWVTVELVGRWHPFDRLAVAGGYRAPEAWDRRVDESIACEAARRHSLQAGAAMLASARTIGLGLAVDPAHGGHAAVVLGHMLQRAGLSLAEALAVSVTGAARAPLSAALRLGRLGAVGMQRSLLSLAPLMARLSADLPDGEEELSAFAPLSEIAMMRPASGRLFVN